MKKGSLIILVFLIVGIAYPWINPISQTDGDDALRQAASRLVHGKYPYSEPTWLGNKITPMPGLVVLAIPFLLLGIHLFSPAMLATLSSTQLLFVLVVLGSRTLLIGSDYLANGILVYWGIRCCE